VEVMSGDTQYVLGYHPDTGMWFLTDPSEVWATVSESLPALLSSIVDQDIVEGPQ